MTSPIGRKGRKKKGPPNRAFTLLEAVVVLFLIGILIGLSVPRFSSVTQDLRLANSARNLAKLLTYAQQRAVVERVSYQAVFDVQGASYWLVRLEQGEGEASVFRIEGRYGKIVTLPPGIEFRFPAQPILFYPDGNSDPFSIELSAQGRRFILTHGFGHVRIHEEKS